MALVCVTCFGTGTALGALVAVSTLVAVPTGGLTTVTLVDAKGLPFQVPVPEMTTTTVTAYANGPQCLLCAGTGILLGS